jgi:heptosyltransferase-2
MNRILVVLPNWFGETLFTTPFLRALRAGCPQGFVAAMGWPQCRDILLRNPRVDAFIEYHEHGRRGPAGIWRIVRTLRGHRFDTAFVLRRSLSRTFALRLAGIPERIGFANAKSGWLLTRRVPGPPPGLHKAGSYLPLLEAVGLRAQPGPYEYAVSDDERSAARRLLGSAPGVERHPLVILHPGANWSHKRWAPERFAALGDRLCLTQGTRIVITGGPDDRGLAEAIRRGMREPATVLAGRTTLRELAACLEHARLVVSNDTGVLHLAAAIGRPVVALYGPTSPVLTGPLGDPARTVVIHHPDSCPQIPCYRPERPPHQGMEAITVDEVYAAALRLLGAQR